MYIHLGSGVVVRSRDIVGIFDIERTTSTSRTREFLSASTRRGEVITVGEDFPKSFVVTSEKAGNRTYISQISPATLKKRTSEKKRDLVNFSISTF